MTNLADKKDIQAEDSELTIIDTSSSISSALSRESTRRLLQQPVVEPQNPLPDSSDSGCHMSPGPPNVKISSPSLKSMSKEENPDLTPPTSAQKIVKNDQGHFIHPYNGRFSPELNEFMEQMYIEAVDPDVFNKRSSFVHQKIAEMKKKEKLDKQFLLKHMVVSSDDRFDARKIQDSGEITNVNGSYRKRSFEDVPFVEITAQVLEEEGSFERGYTSYDLISRTLHQLARDGNHHLLALALDRLGDQCHRRINQLDDQRLAPLHYAARYSHPFTILTLLQKRAKVNIKGQYDITPLHCAARYRKSIQSVKKIKDKRIEGTGLEDEEKEEKEEEEEEAEEKEEKEEEGEEEEGKENEDEKEIDESEEPEVIYLSENDEHSSLKEAEDEDESNVSVVKVLVDNGANVDARDVYGMTPLHYAAMRGHELAARDLLTYGHVDVEARDEQKMTPLFIAATYGYVDICQSLIDKGADIIAMDESEQTTLHRAAAEGHLEILQLLIEAAHKKGGENKVLKFLSIRDRERQTPLHLAVTNGNLEVTKYLLEQGADVNAVRDTLAVPLHAAAIVGNTDLISLLIKHGANIEAVDSNQQTPLHKAAANNQEEAISFLLEHRAKIEKRDKDAFTPFLLAASSGHAEAVEVLIENGALVDVIDKDDKSAVSWSSEQGHLECLKVILENERAVELIDFSDRFDNSPLHEAARNGHVAVMKLLLQKGSKIDNKNEDEETALHVAAEMGQTEVVTEMLKTSKFLINDENEDGNSPLHLASLQGREEVVKVLLEASADVEARNSVLWTPLDCASANGHFNVCKLLIDYDAPLDPLDKTKTTPMQLAGQKGHVDVIKLLLEKGASVSAVDSSGRNALEIAIIHGQRDVAMTIVKSSSWMEALKNVRLDLQTQVRITPFRLLIQRFPDVAKVVLDRCMTTNGLEADHPNYGIKFNFEYIDDTYVINNLNEEMSDAMSVLSSNSVESPYDTDGKLLDVAEPYSSNARLLKSNHPLMLMVKYRRSGLLGHPVSLSLLKHKWTNYGRFVYYFNLIFYMVFLGFLTGYVCTTIDWTYAEFLLKQRNITLPPSGVTCAEVEEFLDVRNDIYATIGKWVIIVMTLLNIIRELFQIFQNRMSYFRIENLLEWVCYVGALLLVIDWTTDSTCFIREVWQWQVGAAVIFLAWLNLVLFLRKLPFFGIYVVMFTDIFATFVRFFIVFFLFIVGFGLSFFMIFKTQVPFEYVGKSLLKTSVMMIGEFEFDSIFNDEGEKLQYPVVSYMLFVAFLILMSILVMNLLVGLAVDDIKAVQDEAVLKRRAMQTRLIMDVEVLIPEFLRRHFSTSHKIFYPNKKRSSLKKMFADFNLLYTSDYSQINGDHISQDDISRSIILMREELNELKRQNQRMYSLFAASLAFKKKIDRIESQLTEDFQ